jgi:hypothetical protein
VSYEFAFATNPEVPQSGAYAGLMNAPHPASGVAYMEMFLSSITGVLYARWLQKTGGTTVLREVTPTLDVWDNRTHHIIFTITDDFGANTTTGTVFIDGVLRASATYPDGTHGALTNPGRIEVGRSGSTNPPGFPGFDGTISHVAVYPIALTISGAGKVTSHYQAMQGWPNQTTDTRIAKLAAIWGYHTTSLETGESILSGQPTRDTDVRSALDVAGIGSEDGLVFVNRSGALTFHSRKHRLNRAVGFTLTAGQISTTLRFELDHSLVRNEATVTKQGTEGQQAVVSDAASIADYDVLSESIDTCLPGDQLVYRGQSFLAKSALPKVRADSLTIPVITSVLGTTLLPLDVGDAFAVSGLPANAPSSTAEFDVEGVEHTFTVDTWHTTVTTSPRNTNSYAVVGSGVYSQVGSVKVGW